MKITKILYLAAVSLGLFLSSCSMNKEAGSTSYLQSGKLQEQQQLIAPNGPHQHLAVVDALQNQQSVASDNIIPSNGSGHIQAPKLQHHAKSFAKSNIIKKAGKSLAQGITVPKTIRNINSLIKNPTFTASSKANPFSGMNYLVMWIVCLVVAVICLALAYIPLIGLIFDILGIIASIFFIIFLILWILQLVQG